MATVLLVDDAENLWPLQTALERDGHRVSVAGDARRALDVLNRERVQLVITDYEMPDTDGATLCRLLRARPGCAELPIIMLSAAPEPVHGARHRTRFPRKRASIRELSTYRFPRGGTANARRVIRWHPSARYQEPLHPPASRRSAAVDSVHGSDRRHLPVWHPYVVTINARFGQAINQSSGFDYCMFEAGGFACEALRVVCSNEVVPPIVLLCAIT